MSGKFPKRSKESPICFFSRKFRLSIANSALDTISARPNLAASVLSSASFDSPCITIQVIYQYFRLPTACPYKRQAVPGWTCLSGPIKKFSDLITVHKLWRQPDWCLPTAALFSLTAILHSLHPWSIFSQSRPHWLLPVQLLKMLCFHQLCSPAL